MSEVGNNAAKFDGFDPNCVESQELTYATDNGGTRFNDVATYCQVMSDGQEVPFSQDGSSTNWAQQLTELAISLQAGYDLLGIIAFVEPRFVNNSDTSDISGNLSNGASSGLPGAPSVAIAAHLDANDIFWRYLNIQICVGQPVPVRTYRKTSALYGDAEYDLTSAPSILGPLNRFERCVNCESGEVSWLKEDPTDPNKLIPATSGEIPKCWYPCGVLALADPPPERECDYIFDDACDNQGQADITQFIPDITRRTTVCNGVITGRDYSKPDPDDANATIPHTLIGKFVDCSTGIEVEDPALPCNDFVSLGNMWHLSLNGDPSTLVEWWADPAGPIAGNAVGHDNVSNIFTNDGSTLSHVSGPADNSYISPVFSVEGSNASDFLTGMGGLATSDTTGTDQGKLSAYFFLKKDAKLRDGGTRTGERGGLWLNECCAGDLELVEERTTDTTATERGVFNGTVIPAGIHYGEALISDLSAWWNLTLEASFDDGQTYGPLLGYQDKPEMECIPVIKCKDSGLLLNALTSEVLDPENLFCDNPCAVAPTSSVTTQTLRIAV